MLARLGTRVEEDVVAEVPFTPDSANLGKSGKRMWEWATGVHDSMWRCGGRAGSKEV